MRDSREKGAGMRDQDPPPLPDPELHFRPFYPCVEMIGLVVDLVVDNEHSNVWNACIGQN